MIEQTVKKESCKEDSMALLTTSFTLQVADKIPSSACEQARYSLLSSCKRYQLMNILQTSLFI